MEDYPQEINFSQTVAAHLQQIEESERQLTLVLINAQYEISTALKYPIASNRDIERAIDLLKQAQFLMENY